MLHIVIFTKPNSTTYIDILHRKQSSELVLIITECKDIIITLYEPPQNFNFSLYTHKKPLLKPKMEGKWTNIETNILLKEHIINTIQIVNETINSIFVHLSYMYSISPMLLVKL